MTASLALAGLVIWQILTIGPFRVDDAYITFSFSKNLATGNGPNFSHGVRVEGYSNFLWMVLNALPLVADPTRDVYLSAPLPLPCWWACTRTFIGHSSPAWRPCPIPRS